jgi:V/A-type H+/Na+-transporting ATPase subunit E
MGFCEKKQMLRKKLCVIRMAASCRENCVKELETGKDKIQKICDLLKKETLEPAQQQAREIVENAQMQAAEILKNAKEEGEALIRAAKEEIEKKKQILAAALQFATRQVLEELKQKIEKRFFQENLQKLIQEKMSSADVIAELLSAIVEAIRKEGIECDLQAYVAKRVSKEEITALLASKVLQELGQKELLLGEFEGGIRLRLEGRNMMIDLSDEALRDLVVQYIREDFRKLIFQK